MNHPVRPKLSVVLSAACLVVGLAAGAPNAVAADKILTVESGSPGGVSTTLMTVLSKIYKRELGISLQINDGQTLTRSGLKLGRQQIDAMPMPPAIYEFLAKGSAMYKKKLHEQAIAASKNVFGIMGYVANLTHAVAFESSGIKTWADIKGKRVFTGPPSGAAAVTTELMIDVITGYKANKDYKAIRLPWGSGLQAMMDGKLDVYARPSGVGSALIEQLGLKHKFYLLSAGDVTKTENWEKRYLSRPGRVTGFIPAHTYPGQLGGDVLTGGSLFMLTVRKGLDDELVYRMTKTIWDNIKEIQNSAVVLKPIDKADPFKGMNAPLHPGAMRYYKEHGFKIPDYLIPHSS